MFVATKLEGGGALVDGPLKKDGFPKPSYQRYRNFTDVYTNALK